MQLAIMLIPAAGGVLACLFKKNKNLHLFTGAICIAVLALCVLQRITCAETSISVFYFNELLSLTFTADRMSMFFGILISSFFVFSAFYGFRYMEHEGEEQRFFTFFLLTLASLMAVSFAGNILTLYMAFECMTLLSMPLVLHNRTGISRKAALYYLGYSSFGASLALVGIFLVAQSGGAMTFIAGGSLSSEGAKGLFTAAYFLMCLGFGAKAGLLPLQAWLPIAHPQAPSVASAILSSIVTKGGVIAIIRVSFYFFTPDVIVGTWAQTLLIILSLLTVFVGSMLALREKLLKKRLAYSTVSQVSYVLFGLFLFNSTGFTGAMYQILFHALAKGVLFLCAGIVIYKYGYTTVAELKGIGKKMPVMLWCFTIASLSLIGIPPMGGFVSKWYLAAGALECGTTLGLIGVIVLLISAALTAFYLLPITAAGFFPGRDHPEANKDEAPLAMLIPIIVFAAALIVFSIFPLF